MWKIRGRSGGRKRPRGLGSGVRVSGLRSAVRGQKENVASDSQLLATVAAGLSARGAFSPSGRGPRTPDLFCYPPLSTAFIDSTACPDASFAGAAFCFCSGLPTTKGMENVRPTVAPPIVVVTATVM